MLMSKFFNLLLLLERIRLLPLVPAYSLSMFGYWSAVVDFVIVAVGIVGFVDYSRYCRWQQTPAFFGLGLTACLYLIHTFFGSIRDRLSGLAGGLIGFDVRIQNTADFGATRIQTTGLLKRKELNFSYHSPFCFEGVM